MGGTQHTSAHPTEHPYNSVHNGWRASKGRFRPRVGSVAVSVDRRELGWSSRVVQWRRLGGRSAGALSPVPGESHASVVVDEGVSCQRVHLPVSVGVRW